MTVSELIAELQKLPPDTMLVALGYEGGLNEILGAEPVKVVDEGEDRPDYYGRYREINMDDPEDASRTDLIDAVEIYSGRTDQATGYL